MVGATRYTAPTNKIIVFNPYAKLPTTMCKVNTAANCIPGRLVQRSGTSDAEIVVNTVNTPPLGFLGYEETNPLYTTIAGKGITDTYAVDAIVAVHNGPGVVWMGYVTGHVYMGDLLSPGAAGVLVPTTALSATIPAGGTTVTTATSSNPTITFAGGYPPQGSICAISEADISTAQGPVRSLI